jgi:UDP-N-acetylmuramyl pentapeptide synthase
MIAVTGSVGKTSTKEMLSFAFSALGKTHSSQGNYNNRLGMPISLASMDKDCDYGIFEIGMNHSGEISPLSDFLIPDLAIITIIAPVHSSCQS